MRKVRGLCAESVCPKGSARFARKKSSCLESVRECADCVKKVYEVVAECSVVVCVENVCKYGGSVRTALHAEWHR